MISKGALFETFAGRDEELALLVDLRDRAARLSKPSCVTIAGPAGIGKSRLVREFTDRTARMRGVLLHVACDSIVPTPYAAASMLLESARESARGFEPLERAYAMLAAVQSRNEPLDGDRESTLYHCAITALQLYAVRRGHLVIAFEDAHECDSASLALAAMLVRRSQHSPLLTITTARNHVDSQTPGRVEALARLERTASYRIVLEPLPAATIVRAIQTALPKTPDVTARDLARRSEGNPFFAEELARFSYGGAKHTAVTLRSATAGRFAALSDEHLAIARTAAIAGREFDLSLLYAIADADETTVDAALRACREIGVVVDGHAGLPAFGHALLREHLESSMPHREAIRLHQKIADILERGDLGRADIFALAYHRWKSGNRAASLAANERAGDSASASNAHFEAAECYGRILDDADPASDVSLRIAPRAANSYATIGQFAVASKIARDTIERLAARERFDDALALATRAIAWAITAGENAAAERAIAEARTLAGRSNDPAARTEFEIAIALLAYADAKEERTLEILDGLEDALAICEPVTELRFRNARALALYGSGKAGAALEDLNRAIGVAIAQSNLRAEFTLTNNLCGMSIEIGHAYAVLSRLEAVTARSRDTDLPNGRALLALTSMRAYLTLGRLGDAVLFANEAIDLDTPFPYLHAEILATAAYVASVTGNDRLAARASADEAVDIARATGVPMCVCNVASTLARACLASNEKLAREFVDVAWIDGAFPTCSSALADAVAIVGNDRQRAFVETSLSRFVSDAANLAAQPRLNSFRAALAFERNARIEGTRLAESAAAAFRELEMPLDEAWCYEISARPNAASAVYDRIGANGGRKRSAEEATIAGSRNGEKLTGREEQVCRLIATGLTNREAAARLSIGTRTAETHLANAYRKLDLRTRAELAAYFR